MRQTTLLFLIITLFFVLNAIPWTLRLSRGRRGVLRADALPGWKQRGVPLLRDGRLGVEQQAQLPLQALRIIDHDDDTQTIAEIMQSVNYSTRRPGKACELLADNVTIDLNDPFRIGVVREVLGANVSVPEWGGSSSGGGGGGDGSERGKRFAYVLMVSNHKYIDGAMVVAHSLREHSQLVRQGACDVVLLVPDKINVAVLELLSYVFHRVKVVRSLDVFSEKSYYKTTFDKMYLYALNDYETVIFFDADSLITGNPDKLFQKVSTVHPLTAVGGSDYFQTALLILKPSWPVFVDLYLEYRYGSFGYNQWRARDGILFRNCLLSMHENIGHPTNSVFHFYGYIKPWFNKDAPYKHAKERLTFDKHYLDWWTRYEQLHLRFFVPLAERDRRQGGGTGYGATALVQRKQKFLPFGVASHEALAEVSPREYMWLQRFSGGSEYHRPTFQTYAQLRNNPSSLEDVGVKIVVGTKVSQSCDAICASGSSDAMECVEGYLQHSALNDCRYIYQGALGPARCAACNYNFDSRGSPFVRGLWVAGATVPPGGVGIKTVGGLECFMNFLHEPTTLPGCNASSPGGTRRVCPCRKKR